MHCLCLPILIASSAVYIPPWYSDSIKSIEYSMTGHAGETLCMVATTTSNAGLCCIHSFTTLGAEWVITSYRSPKKQCYVKYSSIYNTDIPCRC